MYIYIYICIYVYYCNIYIYKVSMLCVQLLIKSTKITQIKHKINWFEPNLKNHNVVCHFEGPDQMEALLYFMKSQSPLVVSFMMSRALRPKPVGLESARPWLCLKKRVVYLQVTAIFQEKKGSKHDQKSWNFGIHYWQTCFDDVKQGEPEKISKKTTKQDGQHWVSSVSLPNLGLNDFNAFTSRPCLFDFIYPLVN